MVNVVINPFLYLVVVECCHGLFPFLGDFHIKEDPKTAVDDFFP